MSTLSLCIFCIMFSEKSPFIRKPLESISSAVLNAVIVSIKVNGNKVNFFFNSTGHYEIIMTGA